MSPGRNQAARSAAAAPSSQRRSPIPRTLDPPQPRAPEQAGWAQEQDQDHEAEAEDLLDRRAKISTDQVLGDAVGEGRDENPDRVLEAADDCDREGLEADQESHAAADPDERPNEHAAERA